MNRWPPVLWLALLYGALFTGLFVASWVAYFWGDGDGERASFCTFVEIFAGPLLAGAVLALLGRRSGLRLLRLGSFVLVAYPPLWRMLWNLDTDPAYIAYLDGRGGPNS